MELDPLSVMKTYWVARYWNRRIVFWDTTGLVADKDFETLLWQKYCGDGSIEYMYGNQILKKIFFKNWSKLGECAIGGHKKDKSANHNMEGTGKQERIEGGNSANTVWANNAGEIQAHSQDSIDDLFQKLLGPQRPTQHVDEGLTAIKSTSSNTDDPSNQETVDTASGMEISAPSNLLRGPGYTSNEHNAQVPSSQPSEPAFIFTPPSCPIFYILDSFFKRFPSKWDDYDKVLDYPDHASVWTGGKTGDESLGLWANFALFEGQGADGGSRSDEKEEGQGSKEEQLPLSGAISIGHASAD